MKRWALGAVALTVAPLVAAIVGVDAAGWPAATGPTYTAAPYLSRPPRTCLLWGRHCLRVGQVVRVRGVFQPSPAGGSAPPLTGGLFATAAQEVGLTVYYGPPDPLAARLRAVPLIARLLPLPPTADHPLLGRLATYRLRVTRCHTFDLLCAFGPRSVQLELADGGTP